MKTVPLTGFDPAGEPQIDMADDGALLLSFAFMPPSWITDPTERRELGPYQSFDRELAEAIGCEVEWEDRELFVIPAPRTDTIERVQRFLVQRGARRP